MRGVPQSECIVESPYQAQTRSYVPSVNDRSLVGYDRKALREDEGVLTRQMQDELVRLEIVKWEHGSGSRRAPFGSVCPSFGEMKVEFYSCERY